MILKNKRNINASNAHLVNLFGNKIGAVKGLTVKKNHNIAAWPIRDNPHPGMKGGKKKRRTCKRRRVRKNKDGTFNKKDLAHNAKCLEKYMLVDNPWMLEEWAKAQAKAQAKRRRKKGGRQTRRRRKRRKSRRRRRTRRLN